MTDLPTAERGCPIGAAAAACGTTARAIRFYEAQGLMPRAQRERGNRYRRYHPADLTRLRFIKRCQTLGFTLEEVRVLLRLDRGDCDAARRLAERQVAEIERRIADLVRLRDGLQTVVQRCANGRRGGSICPILADDP